MGHTLQLGDARVDENKLADLCRHYGVRELSLFGSAVRGEMRPGSDIDIMVEFDPGARIGIIKFESLSEDLEALVGRKIDLVTKRGLKAWIRPHVLKEARVVLGGAPQPLGSKRQKSYNRNRRPMSEHRYTVLFEPCRVSELLTIRARETDKTCHEKWQDPIGKVGRAPL